MGVSQLANICEKLIRFGKKPSTPIALINWGTCSHQKTVIGTLETIVEICEREERIQA